jgi:hypothetical protein
MTNETNNNTSDILMNNLWEYASTIVNNKNELYEIKITHSTKTSELTIQTKVDKEHLVNIAKEFINIIYSL